MNSIDTLLLDTITSIGPVRLLHGKITKDSDVVISVEHFVHRVILYEDYHNITYIRLAFIPPTVNVVIDRSVVTEVGIVVIPAATENNSRTFVYIEVLGFPIVESPGVTVSVTI